ncbi:MAG: hypothetical protein WBL50_22250 [Candidatus Acidiferrum sp.]
MKFRTTLFSIFTVLAIALFTQPAFANELLVDVDKVACPTAAYTSIQAAVNAASPGDHIRICPGTYVEQVVVQKSLTLHAESGAILMPSALQQNATSLFDGSPLAVALLVANATDVTITGLIVDGTNSGISACSPDFFGIAYQNASGTVRHTTVRNFKLGTTLNGCQTGTGIFVQSGGGQISSVTIDSTSVHDFQKNALFGFIHVTPPQKIQSTPSILCVISNNPSGVHSPPRRPPMHRPTNKIRLIVITTVFLAAVTVFGTAAAQKANVPKPQDRLALGEENVKQLLLLMDTDKNGMVSKQDYMRYMEAEFHRLDKSNQGQLNARQLSQSTTISASRFTGK